MVNRRTLYDGIALTLAIVPVVTVIFWFVTLVTAPLAIGVAIYGWNKPGSLVPQSRVRAILAIVIGLLELLGWVLFFYGVSTTA